MAALEIGTKNINLESYDGLVKGVVQIFEAAEKYHIDEKTTQFALELLRDFAPTKNVAVTNCTFVSDQKDAAVRQDEDREDID